MATRWGIEQVLALAPDATSAKAGRTLGVAAPWHDTGCTGGDSPAVWGLCKGSGRQPYQTCVDLTGPVYRCSCPTRKFPCKHALGLLLLWSNGEVAEAGGTPEWVGEWRQARPEREERAAARRESRTSAAAEGTAAADAARKRADQRSARVAAGVDELDRWLADQVRGGIAQAERAGYGHWEQMAARLVDAQAPAVAGTVRQLAAVTTSGAGWSGRLLEELALLRLLTRAYSRITELPEPLAATVRARVGLPVAHDDVRAGPRVRDRWQVIGQRDDQEDQLTARRVWLRGEKAGRVALVLGFAAAGQALPTDLVVGTSIDADVCFYPGALPLRALVAERHHPPEPFAAPAGAGDLAAGLTGYATALSADPWQASWPVLLADAVPTRQDDRWYVRNGAGTAAPLHPRQPEPWSLVAACGGKPTTISAEWTPHGLRLLAAWPHGRLVRP